MEIPSLLNWKHFWKVKVVLFLFQELYLLTTIMGSADIRPILNVIRGIDAQDPINGWAIHKNRLREEFEKRQQEALEKQVQVTGQSQPGFIARILGLGPKISPAAKNAPNLIDLVEKAAKEERASFLKELEQSKIQMAELQKQHEEMVKKQIEENKTKKLKLMDYLLVRLCF